MKTRTPYLYRAEGETRAYDPDRNVGAFFLETLRVHVAARLAQLDGEYSTAGEQHRTAMAATNPRA